MATTYPIRTVSRLTGISLDLLRAWERRYQAIRPQRSDRGRQYTSEDVARLFLLRELVQRGHAIGQIASRSDEELREMTQRTSEVAREAPEPAKSAGGKTGALIGALERFDFAGASTETWRLAGILPRRDFVHDVALPLMREVGDRWHKSSMSVAQEHMASVMVRNALGSLLRDPPADRDAAIIVIGAPAMELHEFGILSAAVLASLAGLQVIYLGPNVPAHDIVVTAKQTGAELVVIGLLDPTPDGAPLQGLRLIAASLPPGIKLWAGGGSVTRPPDLQARIDWLADIPELEARLQTLD